MTTIDTNSAIAGHDHHDPHLAHHFESTQQQMSAGKLGMWIFLGTEILMFGGLFCAYSVYRHNHPDVFEYAHRFLDKRLGAINTAVLITSSLTMAWGVRLAQLGKSNALRICLALTLLGGFGFMGIKSIEYRMKWEHELFPGPTNRYSTFGGKKAVPMVEEEEQRKGSLSTGREVSTAFGIGVPPGSAVKGNPPGQNVIGENVIASQATSQPAAKTPVAPSYDASVDPNVGTPDNPKIKPDLYAINQSVTRKPEAKAEQPVQYEEMSPLDKDRIATFFGIYFLMTGLHGIHVLVGMGLIFWILMRSMNERQRLWGMPGGLASVGLFFVFIGAITEHRPTLIAGIVIAVLGGVWAVINMPRMRKASTGEGEFGPKYFAPVDIVGLYWHLVDLIWIFLFPLLYLIH